MKILHVYKDYAPVLGGIENHVRVLAEAQAAAGHDVTVLVNALGRRDETLVLNGVRVLKAGRLATIGGSVPLSLTFPGLLARERPDVAHLHFPYPVGEATNLLLGRARRTVITYHSDVVRQRLMLRVYRPLLWRVLQRADRIIATSPNYIVTSPFLSRLAGRCTVIPLGVDAARFGTADPAAVAAWRARWGTAAGETVLLFVGRLRYYKGLDTLLRALPLLADRPVRAVLAGDGPPRRELGRLAAALGVAGRVVFQTGVDDAALPAVYHADDVFVLPASSRAEAYGMVITEAMAAGLPCVTCEVGSGTSWVVRHEVTGLVVPPSDPAALAAALRALVDDPERRRRYGAAGRARAAAELGQEEMVRRVLELYAAVLDL